MREQLNMVVEVGVAIGIDGQLQFAALKPHNIEQHLVVQQFV